MRRPADLDPEERVKLQRLCEAAPDTAAACALGQELAQMVHERKAGALDSWVNAVSDSD